MVHRVVEEVRSDFRNGDSLQRVRSCYSLEVQEVEIVRGSVAERRDIRNLKAVSQAEAREAAL